MTTTISDSKNIRQQMILLGLATPDGIALLPPNFFEATSKGELRQPFEAATVKALFRGANLPLCDLFAGVNNPPYVQNNDVNWLIPTIFVTAGYLSENPSFMSVALGVLTNYLTDFFKGRNEKITVKASIIVEKTNSKTSKRIEYEGPVEGLSALAKVVKEVDNDA
jgi:hypothetical protein